MTALDVVHYVCDRAFCVLKFSCEILEIPVFIASSGIVGESKAKGMTHAMALAAVVGLVLGAVRVDTRTPWWLWKINKTLPLED
jgi:hypothetical protein